VLALLVIPAADLKVRGDQVSSVAARKAPPKKTVEKGRSFSIGFPKTSDETLSLLFSPIYAGFAGFLFPSNSS